MINKQQQKLLQLIEGNINYNLVKTIQEDNFQIYLSPALEQLQLDSLISYTLEKFALYCKYMISKLVKRKTQFPSAFKLDIKNDSVTRMNMEHPIIASTQQRLILNPQFINQKYLFENLAYAGNLNLNDNDDFFDELLLTLLFWQIHLKLKQKSELDSYDIYIYPNRCNFFIVQNDISPYFESNQTKMMNILLNTQTISQINNELEIKKEYQIQLFDPHPPDEVVNKGIIIQLTQLNEEEATCLSESSKVFENYKYDQVTISLKPYYFIFSTLCEHDQKDELMHIIDFNPLQQPKCQKCHISIHPDDFETFYTKKGLLDVWENGQKYLKQIAQFISPTFLLEKQNFEIISSGENLYAHFYLKNSKGKSLILNQELKHNLVPFMNNSDIQSTQEFLILYKKLQVCSPYLNYNNKVQDNQLQYSINECLESDQEDDLTQV